MVTQLAVKVVLEMLPTGKLGAIDLDSGAYWDLLGEYTKLTLTLDREVKEVLAELGRGNFSVLELTEDE